MNRFFTIRHVNGRTTAAIKGLPPGGDAPPRPFIVPVFIPQSGCPHRCSFCNQVAITGVPAGRPSVAAVEETVRSCLPQVRDKNRPVQIAFYGGNFLGLPAGQVTDLLTAATSFVKRGDAVSIRFSTRPDTIVPDRLAALRAFPVGTIELGLQSMDDRVLALNRRGHSAACTTAAARLIKSAGYTLGLQMMTGLPGDPPWGAERTADAMIAMKPDVVRIYPTLVLKSSALAQLFQNGSFRPMGLEETITLVSRLFLKFTTAGIRVIRMGLQADEALTPTDTLMGGPYHPALGELVFSHLFFRLAEAALAHHPEHRRPMTLHVHPRHLSRMVGAGRENLHGLSARFPRTALMVRPNAAIGPHHLEVDNTPALIASRSSGP
jgi:histone acetyltransferase (RNA polymerase elongator complex component)